MKVVLKVHRLYLRVRKGFVEVALRLPKPHEHLTLTRQAPMQGGKAVINYLVEFYIDNPSLSLLIFLQHEGQHKFIGECGLKLAEWEENVYHHMETYLTHCPDTQAKLIFDVFYYSPSSIPLHLSESRKKLTLLGQQECLLKQAQQIENQNRNLARNKIKMAFSMLEKKKERENSLSDCRRSISNYTKQWEQYQISWEKIISASGANPKTLSDIKELRETN